VRVRCWVVLKHPKPLKGLKSGFREDLHLIKSVDEGKAIINVTHLRNASVGDESNYKSPSGDLGVFSFLSKMIVLQLVNRS
jgi:hypothetical protein